MGADTGGNSGNAHATRRPRNRARRRPGCDAEFLRLRGIWRGGGTMIVALFHAVSGTRSPGAAKFLGPLRGPGVPAGLLLVAALFRRLEPFEQSARIRARQRLETVRLTALDADDRACLRSCRTNAGPILNITN